MKTNLWLQALSLLIIGLVASSLTFDAWNRMIDHADEVVIESFFGPVLSQKIHDEAVVTLRSQPRESKGVQPLLESPIPLDGLESSAAVFMGKLTDRIKRALMRLNVLFTLSPVLGLLITAFMVNGIVGRHIKQLRFDYPSPLIHRLSIFLIGALLSLTVLLILAPLPFAPHEVIVIALVFAWVLETHLLHLPKRL